MLKRRYRKNWYIFSNCNTLSGGNEPETGLIIELEEKSRLSKISKNIFSRTIPDISTNDKSEASY